jgi:iron complex transport system substrate-binding protein
MRSRAAAVVPVAGFLLVLALALCSAASIAAEAATPAVVDDAGRRVEVPRPGARVIALAPNLTELVYAVGAGAALVGAVDYSDFPEAAKALPRIGDFQRFDVERIVALKPDLVLAWNHGNPSRELAQLEAAGLHLYYLEPKRLDDVPRALERLGALLGHPRQGLERAAAVRAQIDELRRRHAGAALVSVFYQAWANPLMTLSGRQIVSDVIALCGGRNVFADLPQLVPQVSSESVVAANPEAILAARETASARPGLERDPQGPAFTTWRRQRDLVAVRHGWLYTLPGDAITRQGPRIVEGARAVCEALDEVRRERVERR